MAAPTKASNLDLTPIAGKHYFNLVREWREEFIYFLMLDRFHDDQARSPLLQSGRVNGISTPNDFFGGKIKGITNHLDYIAGLGCTAIWISPIFENNQKAYHGYDINNYLGVDPHFGTEQDLIDLVDAAHNFKKAGQPFPMRIILDVVINHSGDNWEYVGGPKSYSNGQQFALDKFRRTDRPIPTELQNQDWYHRRGQISHFDTPPENQLGDIVTLKDYANDDDEIGSAVVNTLIKAHAYWIRQADVDGFRVDAVKHMGPVACSRFCSNLREYAYSLGKRGFFLYGEVAQANDDLYNRYIGQNTSNQDGNKTVFIGLDSVLDFRLAEGNGRGGLRDVLKGFQEPHTLFDRLEAQRQRALNRGEIGRYLVTFVDNHDSFWQPGGRLANGAPDEQVIAFIGYLLCSLGTACIYYGTEQGYSLKIGETWSKLKSLGPSTDWEVYPVSPWNYALELDKGNLAANIQVHERPVGKQPFSAEGVPVELTLKARRLPSWLVVDDSAGPLPVSPVTSKEPEQTITLIPYGAAKLRITAFPYMVPSSQVQAKSE